MLIVTISAYPHDIHYGATIYSTMMNVKLDHSESTPLHDQVAAEIRRALADGEAAPGERLPPAKDLARVLGVNTNTVLRALRILREEELLEFRRGRGVTVAATPEKGAMVSKTLELIEFARTRGFRREEIIQLIQSLP